MGTASQGRIFEPNSRRAQGTCGKDCKHKQLVHKSHQELLNKGTTSTGPKPAGRLHDVNDLDKEPHSALQHVTAICVCVRVCTLGIIGILSDCFSFTVVFLVQQGACGHHANACQRSYASYA